MGATECKGCIASDPTSDTVKVNPTLLAEADSKFAKPVVEQGTPLEASASQKDQEPEEQRLQREAEALQAREAAEEERRRREAEAEAKEQERVEQERMERESAQQRELEERIAREAQERADEEAAQRAQQDEEQALRAEQERLAAELTEAKDKANTFLKARGFTKGIASAKKSCMKTSYPLHVAVEENSADLVVALLKCGADKSAKNSSGLTPLALAQKLDKKRKGTYSAVLAALA